MRIVSDPRVHALVSRAVGHGIHPPHYGLGIERDGEIIAGAVFNCFVPPDIEVTVAGNGWTRGFIDAVGQYVFGQLGCLRITVTTEQYRVVSFAERLGGKIEGLKRNQYGEGRDGYVVGVLKEDWPYSKGPAQQGHGG